MKHSNHTCGTVCKRHSKTVQNKISIKGRIPITVEKFYCPECRKYFTEPNLLYPFNSRYCYDIINMAKEMYGTDEEISKELSRRSKCKVPPTTIWDWRHVHDIRS